MEDHGPGFEIDYGYLCDLAAVCGWRILLARLDDGRLAIRLFDGDEFLAGARFTTEGSLDFAAGLAFRALHSKGLV